MLQPTRTAELGTGVVLVLLAAGMAWRDCLLIAGSAVLGVRLFFIYMDSAAPWEGWRAAIRCVTAGAVVVLAAGALLLLVAGNGWGWWDMAHRGPADSLGWLAGAGIVCCSMRQTQTEALSEAAFWLLVLAAALTATAAQRHGLPAAPCALVFVVALLLARAGWRLAHDAAAGLLQASDFR